MQIHIGVIFAVTEDVGVFYLFYTVVSLEAVLVQLLTRYAANTLDKLFVKSEIKSRRLVEMFTTERHLFSCFAL